MTASSRRTDLVALLAVSVLAPAIALRDMLWSGFALVGGNTEDGRLNAYLLEHSWRWLLRDPLHRALWDLPVFFPAGRNALAFSDVMLTYGPFYWPWRALGFLPDTSYQLWLLAVLAASAAAGYLFLRRGIGASPPSAALGAWLVACAASHLHQLSHSQLLPQFYLLGGLGALLGWSRATAPRARWASALLATGCLVAQLYGGFYLGFFLALATGALAVVALLLPDGRRALLPALRAGWLALLGAGVLAALALVPWLSHYAAADVIVGRRRSWDELLRLAPRGRSWLFMSPRAIAYWWTGEARPFRSLEWGFEHAVGLGFLTTGVLLVAIVAQRRRLGVRLVAAAALLLMAATTLVGGHSLWLLLVGLAPPLHAVRAMVRIGLLLPLAAAVVLAGWVDAQPTRRRRLAATLLLLLCCLEQLTTPTMHAKGEQRRSVAAIASRVDRHAMAFVATESRRGARPQQLQVDAMWASLAAGVPTVNGYSGNVPALWARLQPAQSAVAPEDRARFQARLQRWLVRKGVAPGTVQWILLPADDGDAPPQRK